MKIKAGAFLRLWFFIVVILAIAISINAPLLSKTPHSALIALAIALPLAYYKIFKRNIIIHNLSELIIYPGIAAIFVPLLNLWSIIILLIPAILTSFGATLGLASLFYYSEKGKFYPAMPFITAGCFVALGFYYLVL
jgi:presenilin-like A22 family membrane protease